MTLLETGWPTAPLGRVAKINARTLPDTTDPNFEFRYIDIGSIGHGALIEEPETLIFENAPSRARRVLRPGDTIVSTVRTYLRAVLPIRDDADGLIASTGFAVLSPGADIDSRFLSWYAQSDPFIEEVVARSVGVSYPAIAPSELARFPVPVPALTEQRAIADFLDAETARIDALIEKKRRLLGLLGEKRMALITSTVTGQSEISVVSGRGYGVKSKTVTLKRIASICVSNVDKKSVDGDPRVRLCNYTDVYYRDSINPSQEFMQATASPEQVATFRLKADDVIITKDSEAADDIGVPTYVEASAPDLVCGYHLALIRPLRETVDGRFLFWCMSSSVMRSQMEVAATGITRFGLRTEAIEGAILTLPPLHEQRAIADFLDAETARIDALASKQRRAIELLTEHRQTLITAAVTGEIKVPGSAAPS